MPSDINITFNDAEAQWRRNVSVVVAVVITAAAAALMRRHLPPALALTSLLQKQ